MRQDLLEKALKSIEAKPEHFSMRWFVSVPIGSPDWVKEYMELVAKEPECGTTFCLAGWITHEAIKEGFKPEGFNVAEAALDALELQGELRASMDYVFFQVQLKNPQELRAFLAAKGFIDPEL